MRKEWLRGRRLSMLVVVDLLMLAVAVVCAFVIRLDVEKVRGYYRHIGLLTGLVVLIRPPLFHLFGLYRRVWWYVNRRTLLNLALAILLGSILIVALVVGLVIPLRLLLHFPRSVLLFEPLLSGLFVGTVRLALRIQGERATALRADEAARKVQELGFADEVDVLAEARYFLHRVQRADFDVWVVPDLATGGQEILADEGWQEEMDRLFTAALSLYGLRRYRTAERVLEMLFEALIEGEKRAVLPALHPQEVLQTNLDEAKHCYFRSLFFGWPWETFPERAVKASWRYREIGQEPFSLAEAFRDHPQALKRVTTTLRQWPTPDTDPQARGGGRKPAQETHTQELERRMRERMSKGPDR